MQKIKFRAEVRMQPGDPGEEVGIDPLDTETLNRRSNDGSHCRNGMRALPADAEEEGGHDAGFQIGSVARECQENDSVGTGIETEPWERFRAWRRWRFPAQMLMRGTKL